MSEFFKNGVKSIQGRLVLIIVMISTVSLFMAASMFTYIQLREHRQALIENMTSTAAVIADNVQASLLFDNANDADQILSELKSDHRIVMAVIFDENKNIFSSYNLKNEEPLLLVNVSGEAPYWFKDEHFHIAQPVKFKNNNKVLGYVYLKVSLSLINEQLKNNVIVILVIVLLSLLISVLMTSRLQKIISSPILRLLETTNKIKTEKDYSIRVDSGGYSEIQQLCDGFNSMLTEIEDRDEHMQRLATYDELTGLPNRKYFIDLLDQAIARAERKSQRHAILFMDLDRFKHVNDSLGHSVGDELLIQVARRLEMIIRGDDIVARFGGDEFTFLLQDIPSSNQVADISDRILEVLTEPFDMNNHRVVISPSIGIVLSPDNGKKSEVLLQNADTAMYRAKQAGGDKYLFFTSSMNEEVHSRMELEEDLRNALMQDEFVLHYQPKVELSSGEIVGMEALVRWNRNSNGLVPPNSFIPIAEETGLIITLGNQVLEKATKHSKWLVENQFLKEKVAINISAKQFHQADLIEQIEFYLSEFDLNPEHLELEITEATVMSDMEDAIIIMNKLKDIGISLAMDDFGTGYSSLSYLKKFPFDTLKIDMSFVKDMEDSQVDTNIVKTIVDLAHILDLEVVAEGVETVNQLTTLRDMGCDAIQGYLFSKPLEEKDIIELIKKKSNLYDLDCFSSKIYS